VLSGSMSRGMDRMMALTVSRLAVRGDSRHFSASFDYSHRSTVKSPEWQSCPAVDRSQQLRHPGD
jgi:hypothetical protein